MNDRQVLTGGAESVNVCNVGGSRRHHSTGGKWDNSSAIKEGRHTFIYDYLLEGFERRIIICELVIPND
jgi:hypothetical protein